VSVYLVKGDDPLLRRRVLDDVLHELLAGEDRTFALEEHTVPGRPTKGESAPADGGADARDAREVVVAAVLNAASSPPFMTARRVIVVHDADALTATDAEPIVRFLADPLDTSVLVLVGSRGLAPALAKQLKASKAEVRAPDTEKTQDVLADAVRAANLELRSDAAKTVAGHLGQDAGRVAAFVEVLAAAFPEGAQLSDDDVAPYLGEAGGVPAYQLTNAIEEGDSARALEVLRRLLTVSTPRQPKPMHPLQVMGTLNNYYRRMLRCDDPAIATVDDAVAALGGRISRFPAGKLMEQARALGIDGMREAFDHLYQADLDLKGARGIPEDAVMDVLVVRLARLAARRGRARSGRPGRSGPRR
jgi:DNA polymerase-3 subunit delta